MLQQKEIESIVNEIATKYQPEKIFLFGSHAKDNATNDSDIDLFIIKKTDKRKIERNREVRRCIKQYPSVGIDIIVYTPEELDKASIQFMDTGREAVTTGKLMYERV